MHCIVFTDLVNSSLFWSKYPQRMSVLLLKLEKRIFKYVFRNNGFVVKTVGDAVMAKFEKIYDAVRFATQIQHSLSCKHPLYITKQRRLQIRIGIACSEQIQRRKLTIQGNKLTDYFGTVVNIASRLEGLISSADGFALTVIEKQKQQPLHMSNIFGILQRCCLSQSVIIKYQQRCLLKKLPVHRSFRLITNQMYCRPITQIKGLTKSIMVIKCDKIKCYK